MTNGITIEFTEETKEVLEKAGANEITFHQIGEAINSLPKGVYDIDSSDDAISCLGVPLSFVRNHSSGHIIVMLPAEARLLDCVAR